jgi:type II secretory pathway pseudopilin PulG
VQHRHLTGRTPHSTDGYAMAALLVGMTIMALFLSMALPAWRTAAQREKEEELIFRGQQYARAIALFQRKYANTFPPNLNILLDGHFLRKKYKDPMTTDGEFQVVYANQQAQATGGVVPTQGQPAARTTTVGSGTTTGATGTTTGATGTTTVGSGAGIGAQGGIIGVASKSTATSFRAYNGRSKYNEWVFVAQQASGRIGAPNGSQTPTGGMNLPGGPPGARGGRGNIPPGTGPGRGPGNQTPGPFAPRGGGQGTPFGTPFGQGGFGGAGRGR